jgi:hypothetical protein
MESKKVSALFEIPPNGPEDRREAPMATVETLGARWA